MRKRLGVAAAMTAAFAFGMVGTASAACPSGTPAPPATTALISTTSGPDVAGNLPGVGYGQADPGVSGTNVTYTGSLNGQAAGIGYGDIENGSVGTGGVSGSADGELAGGLLAGSGSLSGATLTVIVGVADNTVCTP
jgi:hypothetical protein